MRQKTALITGANGYIGNAVAKAFSLAGWKVFGLVRRSEHAADLARNEIHPVIGSPEDVSFLDQTRGSIFDLVVSNTDDPRNAAAHFASVNTMLNEIAGRSQQAGVNPLIMFSSGCKDYGMMPERHGDAGLAPHSENSPLNPPDTLVARCAMGAALLDREKTPYDAIVLRPTIVYGLSSSHYGLLFQLGSQSQSVLRIFAHPDAIMHSCHVIDCAEAYVRLAEHPNRNEVAGQAFNISNMKYETARQIGEALAGSYGLKLEFVDPGEDPPMARLHGLANFSQWVSSDKIREATGWRERKSTFIDGIAEYRMAYEATLATRG